MTNHASDGNYMAGPTLSWAFTDKIRALFRRMEAPAIALPHMDSGTIAYMLWASSPNRRGCTVYQEGYLVRFTRGDDVRPFNAGSGIGEACKHLGEAVHWTAAYVDTDREIFVPRLDRELRDLYSRTGGR